ATGMEVELAADGREAYEMAMQQEYDLILMDMQMPEVDGIEATRMLRAAGNQVPVVALTGNVMEQHKSEFKAAGCDDFLAKPIDRQALYRVLERHQQGEGELSEPVVAAVSVEKETISPHQQSDVFNPPESVDDALIELFINRLHDSVATMTESRNQQQWSSLQSEIHMLKGSGETFGFPQITQRARKIESALKDKTYDLALTELDLLYVQIEQVFEWYSGRE
ncbi:MAG: response regulator, partial [Gammaproteobacteria bacterium]|nr:response regulator [Gammaproteobacteria bacterium]